MKHSSYRSLKSALREKGIPYREIGRLLGISRSAVCKKISGVSDFYLHEVRRMQDTFGLDIRFFLPK